MQLVNNIRPLSAIDYLFLFLENRKQPMHVAGLCVFELPSDNEDFFAQLVCHIRSKNFQPTSPFGQVLYKHFFWCDDKEFDIEYHFHHIALPKHNHVSGTKELFAYLSHEHSRTMDKDRPLWEFHLIEGIAPVCEGAPERFAIWLKIHHSVADGIAAIRLLRRSLSTDKNALLTTPFWAFTSERHKQLDGILPTYKSKWQLLKEQVSTIKTVGTELLSNLKNKLNQHSYFVSTFDAPKSILNQKITSTRHLSVQSFAKKRFLNIAKYFNTTTNDVILAICSGALRRYLLTQNALPDKPLIAFVPISLRKDDSANGNQISFLLANLGTHFGNAIARLTAIKQSVSDGKARFSRMSQSQIINYSATVYAWAMLNLATGAFPSRQAFNLIISNVPADSTPLYLHGAKLTGIYPASVLFDGQALNITIINHQDTLDFGITACATALPQIENFTDFVADELRAFENLLKN